MRKYKFNCDGILVFIFTELKHIYMCVCVCVCFLKCKNFNICDRYNDITLKMFLKLNFCGTMLQNVDNVPPTDMRQSSTDTSSPLFSRQVRGGVFSRITLRVLYKHRTKVRKRSRLHVRSEYIVVDCVSWK